MNAADLSPIRSLISRTQGRLRAQAALETFTTALAPALAMTGCVLYGVRMEWLAEGTAKLLIVGCAATTLLAAFVATLRKPPARVVANLLDRSAGLADRLSSAWDFDARIPNDPANETHSLMQAAIIDGLAAASRGDPRLAAPFRRPRDLSAVLTFGAVGLMVLLLRFGPEGKGAPPQNARPATTAAAKSPGEVGLSEEDLDYARSLVLDMREQAKASQDAELLAFSNSLDDLLDKAQNGEMTKKELLAAIDAMEQSQGKEAGEQASRRELEELGKELSREAATHALGEALRTANLAGAKQELEKLAQNIEAGKLPKEEQQKIADAIDEALRTIEQRDEKEQKDADERERKIGRQREAVRTLEKKAEENPKDQETQRRLDREKRQLDRLERDKKQREQKAKTRRLDRLTRKLKESAEDLRNRKPRASKSLRDSAEESQKVEDEIRKIASSQKAQSQLTDLKEALRRAKGGQKGGKSQSERNQRLKDFQRRAGGRAGSSGAWRSGGNGVGQDGQREEKKSSQYGDEHDPNVQGNPTPHTGKTKDESVQGTQGQGPSRKVTILTSAQKGFASESYKRVYADYQKIVEEVIRQDKVPQGYKYFVKRYFENIKPQAQTGGQSETTTQPHTQEQP